MSVGGPRVVIVTRKTQLELLQEKRGTRGQARFYLRTRGAAIEPLEIAHERFHEALRVVSAAIPPEWPRTRVDRDDLDRFLFAAEDIVLAVGQDGLVPNVAKYLREQLVAGVNPDPQSYDGVLCTLAPQDIVPLLRWIERPSSGGFAVQSRIMVRAQREDGLVLRALNEVFIGHRSHQSARYRIRSVGVEERHSSSGVICCSGTGATGWARSIVEQRGIVGQTPRPPDRWLSWFVREPFPSVATGTGLDHGRADDAHPLELTSEMPEGGVVFADGIETDSIEFLSGQKISIAPDGVPLRLVEVARVGAKARAAKRPPAAVPRR